MRRVLPILFAAAVLFALIRLFRVVQRYEPGYRGADFRQAGMGDVTVEFGVSDVVYRSGPQKRWSVHAGKIALKRSQGGDVDDLRSAEVTDISRGTLYRDAKPEATFSARTATYDHFKQSFDVRGDIHVRTAKGEQLEADQLLWSDREDFVRFPSGARGRFGKGNTITAPNLLYAPRKRTVQCPAGVEGIIDGHPSRAAGLFWDLEAGRVDLTGPITGERKDFTFSVSHAVLDLKRHTLDANAGSAILRNVNESTQVESIR